MATISQASGNQAGPDLECDQVSQPRAVAALNVIVTVLVQENATLLIQEIHSSWGTGTRVAMVLGLASTWGSVSGEIELGSRLWLFWDRNLPQQHLEMNLPILDGCQEEQGGRPS